jgi:hypothetical protein
VIVSYFVFMLSGIFIAAAVQKLFSPAEFMKTLYGIGVPRRYRRLTAAAIPIAEAASVILLLIPKSRVVGGACLLALLFSFTIITVKAIVQKKKIECNCFGNIMPGTLGWGGLTRLIVLIVMTSFGMIGSDSDLYGRPSTEIFYQIVASIGILVLYVVVARVVANWNALRKGEV